MNKTMILETAFQTISDAIEWGCDTKDTYVDYVSGIVDMTNNLLGKTAPTVPVEKCDEF